MSNPNHTALTREIKPSQNSEKTYNLELTLDWDGCTEEDKRTLATRAVVVAIQSQLRTAFTSKSNTKDGKIVKNFDQLIRELPKVYNVKKLIVENARKPGKTDAEKAADAFAKLDPAARAALLKQLTGSK